MSEVNLHRTMDAKIWAQEFMETFKNHSDVMPKWLDEALMLGWFANAIMCGWDHANYDKNRRVTREDVLQAVGLAYTSPKNAKKILDSELGIAIANAVFFIPGIHDEKFLDSEEGDKNE